MAKKEKGNGKIQLIIIKNNYRKKIKIKKRKYNVYRKPEHNTHIYKEIINTFNDKKSD